ncbi:hypothetical protein BGI34_12100 [Snodgrassella alvi]|nr:hypothetical protein BGI34_12100 [Snodgrassella alvi]
MYQYAPNGLTWVDPLELKGLICEPKRIKYIHNRHIRRPNGVGNSKFILKEKSKLQAKSKYKKPSQYKKLEE